MTDHSLKEKLASKFRRKPRKSLRSPKRTKRLLRWAQQFDNTAVYFFALGWGRIISAILLTHALFMLPIRPEVGPVLDNAQRGSAALLGYVQLMDVWFRAKRSGRVRQRRKQRQALQPSYMHGSVIA
jgi:hypothetical protein